MYEELESRLDNEPILLLEDDIELTEWVSDMNIEIPEETDAFYLGYSMSIKGFPPAKSLMATLAVTVFSSPGNKVR